MNNLLEIKNLNIRYGKKVVIEKFNLNISNETIVLFGPSGCGKTTILKAILGVDDKNMFAQGDIYFNGKELIQRDGSIGMVFQAGIIPNWLTVDSLCRLGSKIKKCSKAIQDSKIEEILQQFELNEFRFKYPHELSGGQKQRVALAVTLLNDPDILLMDEPTSFLDGVTRNVIWEFIEQKIQPRKLPTLIVSHDPLEAIYLADKIIILNGYGKITEELVIGFQHPRDIELMKNNEFWLYREKLNELTKFNI